jgi:hypothetical protein
MEWRRIRQMGGRAGGASAARFTLPPAVLEIEPDFVLGARLSAKANGGAGRALAVRRVAVAGLRGRALSPSAQRPNLLDPAEVGRGLRSVTEVVGNGSGRWGLLVPDGSVRVAILDFETLPDDSREVETLVRWRMKDGLPFPAEEARLSYQVTAGPGGQGLELVAVAARDSVMAEYEGALDELGGEPELILPATLALFPLVPVDEAEGQLLIHLGSGWLTLAVLVGNRLRFWRSREVGGGDVARVAEEVCSEAARVAAAARDRLQLSVRRVWLCSRPPAPPAILAALAAAVDQPVETLAGASELADALSLPERALVESYGAPLVGLMANRAARAGSAAAKGEGSEPITGP